MRMTLSFALAASLLALAAPSSAHRNWLLPSATIFSAGDDWVTVDAAESSDLFFADHRPLSIDQIKVWAPDGTPGAIANGSTGRTRATFDVHLDKPGTWKIGMAQSAVMGSFKVDGVEWRLGRRRGPAPAAAAGAAPAAPPSVSSIAEIPANATDLDLTEISNRNEIFVTNGAPTQTVLAPSNKGLEMVPVSHPDELVATEPAKLRFLVDGKPAAGLKVTMIPGGKRYRDSEEAMELTTGADGVLSFTAPRPGMYWLNATLTDKNPSTPRATARRMSYITTLEMVAP